MFWFARTHEVDAMGLGGAAWRFRRMPRSGGLDRQDARLLAALDFIRGVANGLLAKQRSAKSDQDELRQFHDREVRKRETVH